MPRLTENGSKDAMPAPMLLQSCDLPPPQQATHERLRYNSKVQELFDHASNYQRAGVARPEKGPPMFNLTSGNCRVQLIALRTEFETLNKLPQQIIQFHP